MASKVKIANLALSRLGVSQLTALTDNTIEAKQVNLMFEEVAKEVMTEGAFSSTIRRQALTQTSNTPAFGFAYEYQLPTDPKCLRVLNVSEVVQSGSASTTILDRDLRGETDYRIEGDKLLANVSAIQIRYIAYLENSGEYDEQLKRVIVARLAADLAYPLTGSAGVADRMNRKYLQEFADAKSVDGQNGSAPEITSTDLTEIR